jgi:glycosyltransferase involved in cell wall biosynthesis
MSNLETGNQTKKVSIIVCAYNEERDVVNCLESILASVKLSQCAELFELYLVDNSSEDQTGVLAEKFCDGLDDFHYVRIKHCGLSVSRNTALIKAQGEFVAYVDADGGVETTWATALLNELAQHNPDILSGPVKESRGVKENTLFELYYLPPQQYAQDYLIGANMIFKKSVLESVNGFPSVFEVRGDESSLLVNLNREHPNLKRIYSKNVIAYNHFCLDMKTFSKGAFNDGERSYLMSVYSHSSSKHLINSIYRMGSTALCVLFFLLALMGIDYSLMSLLGILGFTLLREAKFYTHSLMSLSKNFSLKALSVFLYLLINPLVFNMGYSFEALKFIKRDKDDIKVTSFPEVLN